MAAGPRPVLAGLGPENVAVVVNADSWASMTVANEFIRLRRIPSCNVIYLDHLPDYEQIPVAEFRTRMLGPVLAAIEQRSLSRQIDCIAWSSDLPTIIDFSKDVGDRKLPQNISPGASVTGLTYLHEFVMARDLSYLRLDINRYMRRTLPVSNDPSPADADRARFMAAQSLVGEKKWAEAAAAYEELLADFPRAAELHYNLACCLSRLSKADEAVAALRRAVDAGWSDAGFAEDDDDLEPLRPRDDFKALCAAMRAKKITVQPTIAFRSASAWTPNGEPAVDRDAASGPAKETRSPAREPWPHYMLSTVLAVTSGRANSVAEAVSALRRSAAADGTMPTGTVYYLVNGDIRAKTRQGAFAAAVAALKELGVSAEIVTGVLPEKRPDVMGAMVGSAAFEWAASGSTILPGAICEHLTSFGGIMRDGTGQTPLTEFIRYGAAGSSGTVAEPYAIQAKFPFPFLHVHYARGCSLAEAFYQSVYGPYQLLIVGDPLCQPWARAPRVRLSGMPADGVARGSLGLVPAVEATPAVSIDGFELFVDGVRQSSDRPGARLTLDTRRLTDGCHEIRVVAVAAGAIAAQGRQIADIQVSNGDRSCTLQSTEKSAFYDKRLTLTASAPGAAAIRLLHHGRPLSRIDSAEGQFQIDARKLGMGPVVLHAVAEFSDGARVASRPLNIDVAPPHPRAPVRTASAQNLTDGLLLSPEKSAAVVVKETQSADWLARGGVQTGKSFSLDAFFETPTDGVYQYQVRSDGRISLKVDGQALPAPAAKGWSWLPVSLAAGRHRLVVHGRAGPERKLELRFGGAGTAPLGAPLFQAPSKQR